jgi:hypothetical protein
VAGGDLFAGSRIVHILNTEFAQHQTPIGLRFIPEVCNNGFINAGSFIKFALLTQTLRPFKLDQLLFII